MRAPGTEALVRSRGGLSTKIHLWAEGGGKQMTDARTGEHHEQVALPALPEIGGRAPGPGRSVAAPTAVIGGG